MAENKNAETLFSIRNLVVEYHSGDSVIHAVNDVSLSLNAGETLGLVGETGAGKTTIAKAALRILPEHSESGTKEDIFDHPTHPYTKGLFAALPDLDKDVERLSPIEGLPPDPSQEREECDFYERCPHRCERCLSYNREMVEISPGHFSRCWRTEE